VLTVEALLVIRKKKKGRRWKMVKKKSSRIEIEIPVLEEEEQAE